MSLFQMSVAGGVLILFIVLIRALAIHRLPKTTFLALWMIAALRLLLPFSIPLTFNIHIGLDVFSDVVQELPSGNIASTLPGDSPPSYDIGTAVPSPATEHISTFEILWLVGVLLLAIYFSISYFRSMRKFRMSIPDNTPYIQNWLTAHQISRPLAVRSSDLISSPLTYGILHPVILLPKKLDRNDQVALKYVLTHEYVHIRRFDAITKILFAAVLCIHWFSLAHLLFQHEYSANFLFTLWKRVRKYGACCTGLTQNVDDLLQSHTARTMLANSEFLVMLNQASTDRLELARLLNISDNQLSYITNVEFGRGLIKCGSAIVPFMDNFPKHTQLYQWMTTKPSDLTV